MSYYLANHNVQQGPFDLGDLPNRGLRADSLVWTEGMPDWKRAADVPEVAALLPSQQPPIAPHTVTQARDDNAQPTHPLQYHLPPARPTNGMAIASLVLGIAAFPMSIAYCAGIIPAILALIFGLVARSRIAQDPNQGGTGMALAGTILGGVYLGILGVFILIAIIIGVASAI